MAITDSFIIALIVTTILFGVLLLVVFVISLFSNHNYDKISKEKCNKQTKS